MMRRKQGECSGISQRELKAISIFCSGPRDKIRISQRELKEFCSLFQYFGYFWNLTKRIESQKSCNFMWIYLRNLTKRIESKGLRLHNSEEGLESHKENWKEPPATQVALSWAESHKENWKCMTPTRRESTSWTNLTKRIERLSLQDLYRRGLPSESHKENWKNSFIFRKPQNCRTNLTKRIESHISSERQMLWWWNLTKRIESLNKLYQSLKPKLLNLTKRIEREQSIYSRSAHSSRLRISQRELKVHRQSAQATPLMGISQRELKVLRLEVKEVEGSAESHKENWKGIWKPL